MSKTIPFSPSIQLPTLPLETSILPDIEIFFEFIIISPPSGLAPLRLVTQPLTLLRPLPPLVLIAPEISVILEITKTLPPSPPLPLWPAVGPLPPVNKIEPAE